jgi:hypothetical protein
MNGQNGVMGGAKGTPAAGGNAAGAEDLGKRLCRPFERTVIVAVAAVRVVQVSAHEIVRVPGVRHAFMTACRSMRVALLMTAAGMLGRALRPVDARRGERVFVDVVGVHVVKMAVVQIVRVAVMVHRSVATRRPVLMRMPLVLVTGLSHWRTPSTTQHPPMTDPIQAERFRS